MGYIPIFNRTPLRMTKNDGHWEYVLGRGEEGIFIYCPGRRGGGRRGYLYIVLGGGGGGGYVCHP